MFKPAKLTYAVSFLVFIVVSMGMLIVPVERNLSAKPNITTTENGLWWAITTITGVGYGDYVPTTTVGKIIGAIPEVSGVSTFGMIVAFITVELYRKEQQYFWSRTTDRFNRIEEKLDNIEKKQSFTITNKNK